MGMLHRDIWVFYNGPIPENYHVHHIDGNPLNNELDNLALVPAKTHLSQHSLEYLEDEVHRSEYMERLEKIRPLTKEWHRSDVGKEWHRNNAKTSINLRPILDVVCDKCGNPYSTQGNGRDRFCSNKCKAAYRRKAKLDFVDARCVICGNTFKTDKFKPGKTCSRECAIESQRRSKRRSPDSDK